MVNKKAELYFEEGVPKLKLEGYVFDFRELQNQTRVEKTFFFLLPFIPFISNAIAAAITAVAVSTAAAVAVETFPKVVDGVGRWFERSGNYSAPADNNPVFWRTESSILVDLDKLPKAKGEPSIKTKTKAKVVTLSIIRDKERLRRYTGIHFAWFFNFRTKGLEPYFVISEEEISENQAWVLAVGSLLAQSKLTQIVIDNLLPSLIKNKMDKADRKYIKEKLNSPIDFYSYNESVMKTLAIKTKDTANLIVRNESLADPNNNLNKDSGFNKDNFVVGEGLVNDVIDWTDPKNKFYLDPSRDENKQPYVKIYFPSYHVRRLRMIGDKQKGVKSEFIPRKKMLNVEKAHFLYGKPDKFII
ncbi:hypothetical protein R7V41_00075 [Mesomycoplasma ovipneumoniae]|uniref:hypothetical protein n=1 Tax=Mesomycoplasma ovipneumoniae TaxID=29562 RepID=UPI0029650BAA|nr:hypothetical protein [Mesomycoplasma ovipneumoniae]MDW2913925.1 hypothetical protein [Mesomycoplasma ovipneumoniae]